MAGQGQVLLAQVDRGLGQHERSLPLDLGLLVDGALKEELVALGQPALLGVLDGDVGVEQLELEERRLDRELGGDGPQRPGQEPDGYGDLAVARQVVIQRAVRLAREGPGQRDQPVGRRALPETIGRGRGAITERLPDGPGPPRGPVVPHLEVCAQRREQPGELAGIEVGCRDRAEQLVKQGNERPFHVVAIPGSGGSGAGRHHVHHSDDVGGQVASPRVLGSRAEVPHHELDVGQHLDQRLGEVAQARSRGGGGQECFRSQEHPQGSGPGAPTVAEPTRPHPKRSRGGGA